MHDKDKHKYQAIGTINISVFESDFGKLQTDKVVLTSEREVHIRNHHPDDYFLFEQYAKDVITNPDIILRDVKNVGTVLMIMKLPDSNLNMVIRLAFESDDEGLMNSIMTFYRVRASNLKRLLSKNKIIYNKE